MEEKNLLLLINPNAGKGEIRARALEVIDSLIRQGWTVTVHTTRAAGELIPLLERCGGDFQRVVCCGGDGTFHETVAGLMQLHNPPCLGYLPMGTMNDFASGAGLPRDLLAAAQVAGGAALSTFDLGRFNEDYFTYIAAFGMFTDVSYETPQQSKNIFGRAAYILEGIRRLPQTKSFYMELETEKRQISGSFLFGMVSNALSVGGVALSPRDKISMNDGLLECVLVRQPQSMVEMQRTINAVLAQDYASDTIVALRTDWLRVKSPELAQWTLDGEFGGAPGDILIRNLPGVLQVAAG